MSPEFVAVCFEGRARRSRRIRRRFVRESREISLVPSPHRASTDAFFRTVTRRHPSVNAYARNSLYRSTERSTERAVPHKVWLGQC